PEAALLPSDQPGGVGKAGRRRLLPGAERDARRLLALLQRERADRAAHADADQRTAQSSGKMGDRDRRQGLHRRRKGGCDQRWNGDRVRAAQRHGIRLGERGDRQQLAHGGERVAGAGGGAAHDVRRAERRAHRGGGEPVVRGARDGARAQPNESASPRSRAARSSASGQLSTVPLSSVKARSSSGPATSPTNVSWLSRASAASTGRGPDRTKPPGPSPNSVSSSCSPSVPAPRKSTWAPWPPARQHSASATAKPPSATSCAERSSPRRTAARIASCALRTATTSTSGRPSGSASPRSFASSPPGSDGVNGPANAIASPSAAKPSRPARAASGRRPTIPTTGVG